MTDIDVSWKDLVKELTKPELRERGATGTLLVGKRLSSEEFNVDLRDETAIGIFDKMRRTDSQVNATCLAVELPLRSATWKIDPASDDSKDQEIADFVDSVLFKNRNFTWDSFIRQALKYLQYGFYIFEKVWMVEDGKYILKKLAPRKPVTIREYIQTDDGALEKIRQFALTPKGAYEWLEIPNQYVLAFVNDQEGNNWRGVSMLRPAYRNWLIKEKLMKLDAIKHERQAVGIPRAKLLENATAGDKTDAQTILETMRAHEQAYVIENQNVEFDFMEAGGPDKTLSLIQSIKMHNEEISANILAQFMDLGKTQTGSRALGGELKDFFQMSLQAVAKYLCDTMNESVEGRKLIREIVDFNFPGVKEYPKLICSKIAQVDFELLSRTLGNFSTISAFTPSDDDEDWVRTELNLPKRKEQDGQDRTRKIPLEILNQKGEEEEEAEEAEEKEAEEKKPEKKLKAGEHIHLKSDEFGGDFWRPLTEREKGINLTEIASRQKAYRSELAQIMNDYKKKITDALVQRAEAIMSRQGSFDEFSNAVDAEYTPFAGAFENDVFTVLKDVFVYSQNKVRKELKVQGMALTVTDNPSEAWRAVRKLAELSVSSLERKLFESWKAELIRNKITGTFTKSNLMEFLKNISERDFNDQAKIKVTETFGMARSAEAAKYKDQIELVIRSEAMDFNTCEPCQKVDEMEWKPGDPEEDLFQGGGYVNCEGTSDRCRGINIYQINNKGKE